MSKKILQIRLPVNNKASTSMFGDSPNGGSALEMMNELGHNIMQNFQDQIKKE